MKTLLAITLAAITSAQAITIHWGEDSPDAFNLTITGTGIDYVKTFLTPRGPNGTLNIYQETFISPSGLWELSSEIMVADFYGPGIGDLITINTHAIARFFGLPRPEGMGTINDSNGFSSGFIYGNEPVFYDYGRFNPEGATSSIFEQWNGRTPLFITSVPDYRDPTTWEWVMTIYGHGPSLAATAVPEGGSMILGFLILLVLPLFYEKLRPLRLGK